MTDFRVLCADMLAWAEKASAHYYQQPDVLVRARTALAAEAVVASVGPTDEELLGVAAQTIEPYDEIRLGEYEPENNCAIEVYGSELIAFARAVLGLFGNHFPDATKMVSPAPVPAGEVAELVPLIRQIALVWKPDAMTARQLTRAADLLERQAAPMPVAVSERLPGPEDYDSHGWCWVLYSGYSTWTLEPPYGQDGMPTGWTHWLPATALPLPQGEVEK